jgi:hypothetical protein
MVKHWLDVSSIQTHEWTTNISIKAWWSMCWGSKQKTIFFPTNLSPLSIYVVVRQQSSGGVHTFEGRERELCSRTNIDDEEADLKVV